MPIKELEVVKHCQIHLTEPARTNAAEAMYPIPERTPSLSAPHEHFKEHFRKYVVEYRSRREFTGPHFHGIDDCEISDGVVHVAIGDAGYAYPLHTVARIKVYETVHTPE